LIDEIGNKLFFGINISLVLLYGILFISAWIGLILTWRLNRKKNIWNFAILTHIGLLLGSSCIIKLSSITIKLFTARLIELAWETYMYSHQKEDWYYVYNHFSNHIKKVHKEYHTVNWGNRLDDFTCFIGPYVDRHDEIFETKSDSPKV
jgi:hypothetical protein